MDVVHLAVGLGALSLRCLGHAPVDPERMARRLGHAHTRRIPGWFSGWVSGKLPSLKQRRACCSTLGRAVARIALTIFTLAHFRRCRHRRIRRGQNLARDPRVFPAPDGFLATSARFAAPLHGPAAAVRNGPWATHDVAKLGESTPVTVATPLIELIRIRPVPPPPPPDFFPTPL
jgi:hypothetical protein